nr:hypothetical protein Q903MT_gene6075 [Picea sitchensis]
MLTIYICPLYIFFSFASALSFASASISSSTSSSLALFWRSGRLCWWGAYCSGVGIPCVCAKVWVWME